MLNIKKINKTIKNNIILQYQKNGFIVVKKLLNTFEVLKARQKLKEFIINNKKKFRGRDINYINKKYVNSIHNLNSFYLVKAIKKNKGFKKIIKRFLLKEPKSFGSELFAKPANVGLQSPMHQDNYYWCLNDNFGLTIWIALTDTDHNNGSVFYFKGSHKMGLLEHRPSFVPGSSQTIKCPDSMKFFTKVAPKLKAGDCLIHNCLIVHGSNRNKSNKSRIGLTLRYIARSSKFNQLLKHKYELELKKQRKK